MFHGPELQQILMPMKHLCIPNDESRQTIYGVAWEILTLKTN